MPTYRIAKSGLAGYVDINDLQPHEMPPEAWSFVQNTRMFNGRAQSVLPWKKHIDTDGSADAQKIHAMDYYTPSGGDQHLYLYSDNILYSVRNDGDVNDVTKIGLNTSAYPEKLWVTDRFNGFPVLTNFFDKPQCFYNAGSPSTPIAPTDRSIDIPNWPITNPTCLLIRSYKNFLVMLNVVDVDAFPNMVWWSDAAEPGLMPPSWDYANPETLSGRAIIGADSGAIIAAEVLRDSLFIYTEYATWRMDFVGGQFVMRFTKVFDNLGAFGPRSVAAYGGQHFVLTQDDIVVHDGQQSRSIGDNRVRYRVTEAIDVGDRNRVWVTPYLKYLEIWFGVPDPEEVSNQKSINTALVWQGDEDVWALRDLPDSRIMKMMPLIDPSDVDDTWDGGVDVSWDTGPNNIWNTTGSIGDLVPLVPSTLDGDIQRMDRGEQTEDTLLQRYDINFVDDTSNQMAVSVYPRVTGSEIIKVRMGVHNSVGGDIRWDREVDFDPKVDYHVTARATGRRHAIEFRGKNFELEGYDIEYVPAGNR